jgi:hypothetical protein
MQPSPSYARHGAPVVNVGLGGASSNRAGKPHAVRMRPSATPIPMSSALTSMTSSPRMSTDDAACPLPVRNMLRDVLQRIMPARLVQPSEHHVLGPAAQPVMADVSVVDNRDLTVPYRVSMPELDRLAAAAKKASLMDDSAASTPRGAAAGGGVPRLDLVRASPIVMAPPSNTVAATAIVSHRLAQLAQPHRKFKAMKARFTPGDVFAPRHLDETLAMITENRVFESRRLRRDAELRHFAAVRTAVASEAYGAHDAKTSPRRLRAAETVNATSAASGAHHEGAQRASRMHGQALARAKRNIVRPDEKYAPLEDDESDPFGFTPPLRSLPTPTHMSATVLEGASREQLPSLAKTPSFANTPSFSSTPKSTPAQPPAGPVEGLFSPFTTM